MGQAVAEAPRNFNLRRNRQLSRGGLLRVYAFALGSGAIEFCVPRVSFPIDLVTLFSHNLLVAWQLGNHKILEDSMKVSSTTRECRPLMVGLSALIVVLVISGSAFAQDRSTPNWDVFVGYQYLNPGATVPTAGGDPN